MKSACVGVLSIIEVLLRLESLIRAVDTYGHFLNRGKTKPYLWLQGQLP